MSDDRQLVRRGDLVLRPDDRRVLALPFLPGQELPQHGISRAEAVIERLSGMSDEDVSRTLAATLEAFSERHHDLRAIFREHFGLIAHRLPDSSRVSQERSELMGAYLTQEFAIEAAALFNPSIVEHPDQDGVGPGAVRFIMSVRAVGEGHLSSIEFRTGILTADGGVELDEPGTRLTTGRATPIQMSTDFLREALDEGGDAFTAESVLRQLPARFTPDQLESVLASIEQDRNGWNRHDGLIERIRRVAASCYELTFPPGRDLSECVIRPSSAAESHGLEDARFVRFVAEDGSVTYYATYTAYDGSAIAPHLLRTDDFTSFSIRQQIGPAAKNKGMALFPRHIRGQFWSLSRWDRESISVASSPDALRWGRPVTIQSPRRPWEMIQLGACSSPLETDRGWLVFTHGVGPMRTYSIGAILLDLDDPTVVLGVLPEPLLTPNADERNGYVPNVVYSCGALVHGRSVVLPYGCSDSSIRFAFVDLPGLLDRLTS